MVNKRRKNKNKSRHGNATQQPHSPAATTPTPTTPTTAQEQAQELVHEQQQKPQEVARTQDQVVATEDEQQQQQQQQQQLHETDDMQVESEQQQHEQEQDEQLTQLEAQEQTEESMQVQASAQEEEMQEPADTTPADEPMQDESEEQREQHQHSERELTKLRAIEAKVQQIHDKLTTRMPLQRKHLAARVCGAIWAARVRLAKMRDSSSNNNSNDALAQQLEQQRELYHATVKKLRMELGAFDYQAKEQGELLTRHLCDLDDILSFGNAHVKEARKALVVFIQRDALPLADALRDQSARLKAFGEALIAALPQPDAETKAPATPTADPASIKSESKPTAKNDVAEDSDTENQDMDNNSNGDDNNGASDGDDDASDAFATKRPAPPSPPHQRLNHHHQQYERPPAQKQPQSDHPHQQQQPQHQHAPPQYRRPVPPHQQKPTAEVEALPVWRPYYQLQKRRDGLYLIAKLHDVEPANLHVQWNDRVGVLRISGHKLPTQKDIMVSRFSGVPTFGRFDILERLPAESLAMDHATQKLYPDGTLEIRMPYYVAPRVPPQASLFSPSSLFDTPRHMFW